MTRTVRRYNKKPLRLGPGYCGWISSNKIPEQDNEYPTIWYGDYHPWKQGYHIAGWKDWRLDSKRRQANKRMVRQLFWEYSPYGIPDVYDLSYSLEYEYYMWLWWRDIKISIYEYDIPDGNQ